MRTVRPLATLQGRLIATVSVLGIVAVGLVVLASVLSAHLSELKFREQVVTDNLVRVQFAVFEGVRGIESDLIILANTPSIQDIIIPGLATGSREQSVSRLERAFASFLDARGDYRQIRLVHTDGRELVRADRRDGQIVITPRALLQDKGDRSYTQIAAGLAPGQFFLMSPSWNIENGEIEEPRWPASRLILPVFDREGRRFGFIIVNYDTVAFTDRFIKALQLHDDVYIVNTLGGTYVFNGTTQSGRIYLDGEDVLPPDVTRAIELGKEIATPRLIGDRSVAYRTLGVGRPADEQVMIALVSDTKGAGAQFVGRLAGGLAVFGLTVLFGVVVLARIVVRRTMAPFNAMAGEISRARNVGEKPALPVEREDEVGAVSREFVALLHTLEREAEKDARMQRLLDRTGRAAGVGGWEINLETNEVIWTNETRHIHGVDADYIPSVEKGIEFYAPEARDTITEVVMKGMEDGKPWDLELPFIRASGERIWVRAIGEVEIQDGTPRRIFGAFQNITERIRQEEELGKTVAALQRSNEELDRFGYVASHDLKAPLRAIAMSAQWLAEDLKGKLDADTQETLDLMQNRVQRMNLLLEGMLEHARIGRKNGDSQSPMVPGADLADDIRVLVNAPDGFGLEFTERFRDMAMQQMPLRTVLLNLVSNAIKHRERADGRVSVDAIEGDDVVRFSVEDNGPGIDPQFHERVFELFQTLKPRDEVEGSGLGLSIAQKTVRHMGGELTLHSQGAGTGCRFEFTWPRAGSTPEERAA